MTSTLIRQVHADEVSFELHLAKKFTDQIGFLTREAVEHYAAIGGVWRANENNQAAGFLVFTPSNKSESRTAQIYQAAIELDAQRRHHGLALVELACTRAYLAGANTIQCYCACDLPSNEFWAAAGFTQIGKRQGGRRRDRQHWLWKKALAPGIELVCPKSDAQDAPGRPQRLLFDPKHLD